MVIKSVMKQILRKALRSFGYEVRRADARDSLDRRQFPDMRGGLLRLHELNISIGTVVDVGAAEGKWSVMAQRNWPSASFILFEPLSERTSVLEALVLANPRFHLVPAAAGSRKGVVKFSVASDLDGSGIAEDDIEGDVRIVNVTSIDDEVAERDLQGPYMVKLDTHGFEIPILEGCSTIWPKIDVFVIECYGFRIIKDCLLFWEMCGYMESRGFRLFNIADVMHRLKDGAFWQCDAIFIRKSHPIFEDNRYY